MKMSAVLLVKGTIAYGRLHDFAQAVAAFVEYRRRHGWAVPEVLYGLAGPMNTVLMVFRYKELREWEAECTAERSDLDYGRVASGLPYAEGSIVYELYQTHA
jgi:hypothetical protein